MLQLIFGTPLEQAIRAYNKHERKYNECCSKAEMARSNFNYDLADKLSAEARNHVNMMDHYEKVISRNTPVETDTVEE